MVSPINPSHNAYNSPLNPQQFTKDVIRTIFQALSGTLSDPSNPYGGIKPFANTVQCVVNQDAGLVSSDELTAVNNILSGVMTDTNIPSFLQGIGNLFAALSKSDPSLKQADTNGFINTMTTSNNPVDQLYAISQMGYNYANCSTLPNGPSDLQAALNSTSLDDFINNSAELNQDIANQLSTP